MVALLVDADTGCLLWRGAKDKDGYGVVRVGKRTMRAHRWAWERTFGEGTLGKNDVLLHACDRPACCNVEHLRKGTQVENLQDRDAKGRQAVGAKNGRSKARRGWAAHDWEKRS